MPRLLLVTPRWATRDVYGGEVSVRLLKEGLEAAGWHVHVAAEEVEGEPEAVTQTELTGRALHALVREVEPDLLHCYNMEAIQACLLAAKITGTPAVASANSYWATCLWADMTFPSGEICQGCSVQGVQRDYQERDPSTIGRRLPAPVGRLEVARRTAVLNRFDRIVALTEASRDQLGKGGVPTDRIEVIGNMVDPRDLEASLPELTSAPRLLYVGQLKHIKGVGVLVEAMPRVLEAVPEAELAIAGTGPQREGLEARCRGLGIADAVTFVGHVAPETLREMYREARAVAMPTIWIEPFGRVLLEAWSHGAVVVASDRGGPAEVLEDGETGQIVPAEDAPALADALVEVLLDDEKAGRLRRRAREELQAYTPEAILERYRQLYGDVLEAS